MERRMAVAEASSIDVGALYTRYGPMVLRRCRRLLKDEERAVDAMHDTFVRLVRNQKQLEDRGLSSLLFRMATQVSLNQIRSSKRRPETGDERLLVRLAALGDNEERAHASRFLGRLFAAEPESTRTMAVLHLLDGMTLEEVAAEVGMSVSGVRKRLRRLKAQAEAWAEEDR